MCYLAPNQVRSRYVGTNNTRQYLGAYRAGNGITTPSKSTYLTDNCARSRYFGGNHKTWYLVANRAEPWYLRDACSKWYLVFKCTRPWYNAVMRRGVPCRQPTARGRSTSTLTGHGGILPPTANVLTSLAPPVKGGTLAPTTHGSGTLLSARGHGTSVPTVQQHYTTVRRLNWEDEGSRDRTP